MSAVNVAFYREIIEVVSVNKSFSMSKLRPHAYEGTTQLAVGSAPEVD